MGGRRSIGWALALVTTLGASTAWAQTGTVSGRVTDDAGAGVANAEVRVEGTTIRTTTDEQGRYELRDVPAGERTLRVLILGFKSQVRPVTVTAGATATLDFQLEKSVIPLPEVLVGSRARHTAADELAVPVDVYNREVLARQGSTETSQALQALSPSVNFPRQSVTDATDVVRPFTLRGLSPDHTLVLLNGLRRHQTALVNTFAYGTAAGSSGVDLNALPSSAIDRVEVLRDGAAAQYGSDAIAGVVNVVTRRGRYAPFVTVTGGQHFSADFPNDGGVVNVAGGWGLPIGAQGSLSLAAEFLDRQPTNRAWADPFENGGVPGNEDVIGPDGQVITKNNPVPQPNHHWGDGLERDLLTMATAHLPLSGSAALYAWGGYSFREGNGNGYRRYTDSGRNWPQIYPIGFLPEFRPKVTDFSAATGVKSEVNGWNLDAGVTYGHNGFRYELRHTLNTSLGPSLTNPVAPGPDGIFGNGDDPGIPNQTSFFAGELRRDDFVLEGSASKDVALGLPEPVHMAVGLSLRREHWRALAGERASWIDGGHPDQFGGDAPGGSQVFPGLAPSDEADANRDNVGAYLDLETKLVPELLVNAAARFENYSDFGGVITGKLAARVQPTPRVTMRAAASTGFRAPGLAQIHFSKVITNVISGTPVEIGVYPVNHPAARLLGSRDLDEERSLNLSAGIAVTPVDNLTLAVDVYDIRVTDRILLGATFDDSTTLRILGNAGYSDIAGVQYFTNGLDTKTTGVDVTADLRLDFGAGRSLGLRGALNWGRNEITHADGVPAELATSTDETGILDEVTQVAIEEERPDWRGTLTAEYSHQSVRGLARVAYYGTFASAQPAFTPGYREEYPARTLLDLEAGYRYGPAELSLGARNVFDTYPGKATLDYNNNFGVFPWAAASPFGYNGRFLYSKLTWTLPR
jgi:iron complex outermembrane receptor protein